MTPSWIDSLVSARVYDLEQPRFAGMPIHPVHRPGYFYALHRRHRDGWQPERHGPRSRPEEPRALSTVKRLPTSCGSTNDWSPPSKASIRR